MRKASLSSLTTGMLFMSASVWAQTNPCALTGDATVSAADVQAAINMTLGLSPCTANIAGLDVCNIVVVQRVINAALGGACVTSTGIHSVVLTWTASTSSGVTSYNVYRGTTSGSYTLLASAGSQTTYTDNAVVSGTTYYYVVTALVGTTESAYSTPPAQAAIPTP
jgi:hypothetical protein